MNKRNICRTATLLCGLLAILIHTQPDTSWPNDKLMGTALMLVSAIFGTQWAEYQKRHDATSDQPGTPAWLRKLLFSGLLLLTMAGANAQTTWTARPQTGDKQLSGIAYGAGRYVAVGGDDGLIRISTDGITWINQVAGTTSANGLIGIVYAAGKFVTVGDNGRILTSTDGLTWTTQISGVNSLFRSITYGGGQFVAVGFSGTILTLADGVTWTLQTPDLTENVNLQFQDVTYGGGQFVIVGDQGVIQTSPNGVTWTSRTSGPAAGLYGVTAGGNGNFVAVGTNSTVVTSPDGVTWTPQTIAGPVNFLISVTYNPTTGQFVAVAATNNRLFTSLNGFNWTPHPSGTYNSLKEVRYLNGQFIAVGDNGAIQSSPDGMTWKPLTITGGMNFEGAAYGNGRYVAVGSYQTDPTVQTSNASLAATSGDGMKYELATTQDPTGTNNGLQDVAFGNGLFVAVGKKAGIQTSTDGNVWQLRYDDALKSLNAIAYGGGQFVAVGPAGLVLRSTNGLTWAPGSSIQGTNYAGITYANGQFVAVGQSGAIGTSPDGVTWTARTSGTNNSLTSVVYGNGVFVAVGIGGKVFRSADGVTWSSVLPFTTYALYAVTFANGLFVVVGEAFNSESKLATSPDGITWTALASKTFYTLRSVTHGNGLFVAVGDYSKFTTSPDDGGMPPANQAPTVANSIPNQVVTVGQNFSYSIPAGTFSDPNGDALTLSIGGLPNGLTLNGNTIGGTPTTVEAPTVTVTATDPGNLFVSNQFTITVSAPPVNPVAPVAPALPNQVATVGSLFSYVVPAFTGTAPITYQASGLPDGLSFNAGSRTISGTPTTVQAPTVTITASNAVGQNMGQFTITVNAAPVNPGTFAITGVTLVSCQALSTTQRQLVFTPQYAGANGQPISFEVVNEMVPTTNAGPYTLGMYIDNPTITLKATQSGTPGQASFAYNWLAGCSGGVPSGNQPPIAPVIPDASATVGQVYAQTIPLFTDPEGQPLTYSVIGLPPGLLVIGGGNIVGPPSTAGVYVITVTATDPGGLSASATYTLTIYPVGGNPGAFAITGVSLVSCQEIAPGKHQLVFTPQYAGTNGQPISFEVVNEMVPTINAGPYTLGMYIDNPTITLKATQSGTMGEASFIYSWLFACSVGDGARQGVKPTPESALEVRVLGNPVENGALSVEVRGVGGQPVQMTLSDLRGQDVGSHQVRQADSVEQHRFEMGQQPAGLYLLRVSTLTQRKTVKILKR